MIDLGMLLIQLECHFAGAGAQERHIMARQDHFQHIHLERIIFDDKDGGSGHAGLGCA